MTTLHQHSFMGFEGFGEIIEAMFKPHQLQLKNLIILAMTVTLLLNFVPVLEAWIWSPFWTLVVFYVVVVWDFISAVAANNKKTGEGFITQKAKKVPIVIFSYTLLFIVLHLLGRVVEAMGVGDLLNPVAFDYLAKGVYFLCFFINFLSALKHMSMLGLLPASVTSFISKFIDIHKNKIEQGVVQASEAPSKSDDNV
jgi:hypothetical protein